MKQRDLGDFLEKFCKKVKKNNVIIFFLKEIV